VVWFALPLDLAQLPVSSLLTLHIAPPPLLVITWFLSKRVWASHVTRVESRAAAARESAQQRELDAARAAHMAELNRRRAHVECRAVWGSVPNIPDWYDGPTAQATLLVQNEKAQKSALAPLLQKVFETALRQSEATVWLPVYIVPGRDLDGMTQLEWVGQVRQSVAECNVRQFPAKPVCSLLPGRGHVSDRVIALFENDSTLPALVLLGMDALSGDAREDDSGSAVKPGYSVVAMLLSRPGLIMMTDAEIAASQRAAADLHSHRPFWEKEQEHAAQIDRVQWSFVPAPLQPGLMSLKPFATLYRSARSQDKLARGNALARQLQPLIKEVLVNAALFDLPFNDNKASKRQEAGNDLEPPTLDLGWLVYDSGVPDHKGRGLRFTSVIAALDSLGCELEPVDEVSDLFAEHGDVGAARGMLMLAEALIHAGQLQKPVLFAEFDDKGGTVDVGLVTANCG
jgi:hypothetical protein